MSNTFTALLLEQGHVDEAEEVYRADIFPAKTCFCAQDALDTKCYD